MTESKEKKRGSEVLAYTTTYGNRPYLSRVVPEFRGTAGCWFDWLVCMGDPSPQLKAAGESLLNDPRGMGIQYLVQWDENRGQHHGTKAALELARERGYKWLLRIDDDFQKKTARWLKKMLNRADEIKELTEDDIYRFVLCPTILRLKAPIPAKGVLEKDQPYDVEIVPVQGGFRLHPVELLNGYNPPLYSPMGRDDPQSIREHLDRVEGWFARFKDIRVVHDTREIEKEDDEHRGAMRFMGHYWPFLESPDV